MHLIELFNLGRIAGPAFLGLSFKNMQLSWSVLFLFVAPRYFIATIDRGIF
jgi:hypothetical protein